MGMITRVRGRLHSITKIDPQVKEEKIAETVCLLSVVFLLPYCGRGNTLLLGLGGMWLAMYSCLVLPVLISANYKYPVRWLRRLINHLPGVLERASGPTLHFLGKLYAPVERCERVFLRMSNLTNMANQLLFFMMCDRVLLSGQHKKATALYTLMFYNVVAYCAAYIKELVQKEDWSPYVPMTQHSNLKHLAMSATKIVLEWTKAVTFLITATFMLLVFGLEQGLQHYQPSALYSAATALYYLCTEKAFAELFPALLTALRLERLEALEALWAPVLLRGCAVTLAAVLAALLALLGQLRFAALAAYLAVWLKAKDAWGTCVRELRAESAVLAQFRPATAQELDEWDDICAVCLSPMRRARITPCHHLFHADCLRLCLNNSHHCPMCKQHYTFH